MKEKTAIDKMVEWLEEWQLDYKKGPCSGVAHCLRKAKILAAEEAEEKPLTPCDYCALECPKSEKPVKCEYWEMGAFAPVCRNPKQEDTDGWECPYQTDGECNIIKENPIANSSLIEDIKKLQGFTHNEEGGPTWVYDGYEVERILSRYRPSTQADIVGELKEMILRRSQAAGKNLVCCDIWTKEIEEIIAKHEGAK